MKKSGCVPATLIVAFAASLSTAGCSSSGTNQCVDAQGNVLPDSACRSGTVSGAHYIHTGGFGSSSSSGGFFGG